jgi:hypothetical protein
MEEQDDLPPVEADANDVPEMESDDEALRIFRTTEFLHRSVKS